MSYAYLDTLRSMMEESISFTGIYSIYDENGYYVGEISVDSSGYAYIEISEGNVRFEGKVTLDKGSKIAIMYSEYVDYAMAGDKEITNYGGRFLIYYDFSAGYTTMREVMTYTIPIDLTGNHPVYNAEGTFLGYLTVYSDGSLWLENNNYNNARVTVNMQYYSMMDSSTIFIDNDQILAAYDHFEGGYVDLYGSDVYFHFDEHYECAVIECDYLEQRMLLRNTTNFQFEIITPDNVVAGYVTVYGDQSSTITIFNSDYSFILPAFDYVDENGAVYFSYYDVDVCYNGVTYGASYGVSYKFDFMNGDCYVSSPHVSAALFSSVNFEAYDTYGNFVGYLYVQPTSYDKFLLRLDYDAKDCYFYATQIELGSFGDEGVTVYSSNLTIIPYSDSDRVNQPWSDLVITYGYSPYTLIVDYNFAGVSVW